MFFDEKIAQGSLEDGVPQKFELLIVARRTRGGAG